MDQLYDLTFYVEEGSEEGFHIGLFLTREEAEAAAARYLSEVPGFRDYDCIPRVTAFPVIGGGKDTVEVYRFEGWNVGKDLEEKDILISSCFADWSEAEAALAQTAMETRRDEWALNRHVIGQCDWAEGFARELPLDPQLRIQTKKDETGRRR